MVLLSEVTMELLVFIIYLSSSSFCECKTFNIGLLFPWNGFWAVGSHSAGAATLSLDTVTSDNLTFAAINSAGHRFRISWNDTHCTTQSGLPLLLNMLSGRGFPKVDVFIGPACSVICEPGGYLAQDWNIPMISFGSSSGIMSNKTLYPTFARTSSPLRFTAPLFVEILTHFRYSRVAIFTGFEPIWNRAATDIRNYLLKNKIQVTDYVILTGTNVRSHLATITESSKGNLMLLYVFIFVSIYCVYFSD